MSKLEVAKKMMKGGKHIIIGWMKYSDMKGKVLVLKVVLAS